MDLWPTCGSCVENNLENTYPQMNAENRRLKTKPSLTARVGISSRVSLNLRKSAFVCGHMNFITLSAALCFFFFATLTSLAGDTNWTSLFNGKDLAGWQVMNDGVFTVTNDVLRIERGMGWLRTEKEFTDFVLEAECRGLETNYNSGFFVRSGQAGKPFPDGGLQVNLKQSALGALVRGKDVVLQSKTPPQPAGEWMKFRIEARGRSLKLSVNGGNVWEFTELEPASGHVGIQAEGRRMEFRNVRLAGFPK